MRWKCTLWVMGPLAAALAAGLLLRSPLAPPFQANRVRYLMNAHQYRAALEQYDRLLAEHPRQAGRLPGDFRVGLIEDAAGYYSRDLTRRAEGAAYEAFLDAAARRRELAPLVRRKRLAFHARQDRQSSATLRAASEILENEGFDREAFWWAAVSRYDPHRPLLIPRELLAWRKAFKDDLAASQARPSPEETARRAFLGALLALADRNWAEAAAGLDRYRRQRPDPDGLDLPQGLATLNAGNPAAAIHHLLKYREKNPAHPDALRWLAEAYLALPDYAWAGQALHEIRRLAPEQEGPLLREAFGPAGGSDPLAWLCAELRRGGTYAGDVALWGWLCEMARTDGQRRAVDAAAEELIAAGVHRPEDQAILARQLLWRGRLDAARRLLAVADADATATLYRQSLERVLAWYPQRQQGAAAARSGGEETQPLLTHDATSSLTLTLPQGATLVVLMAQGYPAGGVWPIVHVNLGEFGSQIVYLGDSRTQARPIVLALRRPAPRTMKLEGAVSLINGGEAGGESRNVMIAEARGF